MRILITSIVDLKKTAHNRLHQFVKHLSRNHEVTVLSINDWWKAGQVDTQLYAQGFEDALQRIRIKYFTERKRSPIVQEIAAAKIVGQILDEVDYRNFDVHLNYSTLISGYFVAKKMKSTGINTVYDVADDLPAMVRTSPQISPVLRPVGGLVAQVMIKKNIKIAQRVTFITSLLGNSYHIPQSKSNLIPNGVDTELFTNKTSNQFRREIGITDQDFVVGYVGALREWTDFEPIFAKVAQLDTEGSNITILIVGGEGDPGKIRDSAIRHGVADKVILTGTIPYPQVPKYISCMDVCLIACKTNPVTEKMLPLKLFEYMACEKPVISPKLEGVEEVVQDKVLYTSNSEDLKKKIMELYRNEGLRRKMGLEGRKYVEQNYSWAKSCFQLEELLLEGAKDKR